MVFAGVEMSCCCMVWRIGGNGDAALDAGLGMGIYEIAVPTGSVKRFARSKVWQNTTGSSTPSPCPAFRLALAEPTICHSQNDSISTATVAFAKYIHKNAPLLLSNCPNPSYLH